MKLFLLNEYVGWHKNNLITKSIYQKYITTFYKNQDYE